MPPRPIGYTTEDGKIFGPDGSGQANSPQSTMFGSTQNVANPMAGQTFTDPGTGDTGGTFANGDTSAGMTPMTGFASRYTPAMASQAYENPWYLLADVFSGMSESSPLYQALRDFGGDPLTLFNIMQGSNQKIDQGEGDFINWMNEFYKNMGTPGGAGLDAGKLISTLFGQDKFGADSDNTLGQILGAGDMGTQTRTLFNMLRDVSNAAMNPLAARGYQSAIAQAGDRYGNAQMKADENSTMNPVEWMNKNTPWLANR